jgi:flagellar assembly protein FliH
MSSSDRQPAPAPWALDEFAAADVFTPLADVYGDAPGAGTIPPALEALVEAQLAARRPALERAAYERGRAEGARLAGEQSREPMRRVLEALTEAAEAVRAHEQRWLGNLEENLAAVAVSVARHLIDRELTADPSLVGDLVARALRQFPLETKLSVRLHPDDHALVGRALAADTLPIDPALAIHWVPDAQVVRGGCLVEGRERVLDGRLDSALERAYRALGQVQA